MTREGQERKIWLTVSSFSRENEGDSVDIFEYFLIYFFNLKNIMMSTCACICIINGWGCPHDDSMEVFSNFFLAYEVNTALFSIISFILKF